MPTTQQSAFQQLLFQAWPVPTRCCGISSAVAIGLYTLLVVADAAVVRAALMGTQALFAHQVDRQQNGLNSQGLVAALMVQIAIDNLLAGLKGESLPKCVNPEVYD